MLRYFYQPFLIITTSRIDSSIETKFIELSSIEGDLEYLCSS